MSEQKSPPAFMPMLASEDLDRMIAYYTKLGYAENCTMIGPDGKAVHTMLTTPCGRVSFMAGTSPEFKGPANGFSFYVSTPEGVAVEEMFDTIKGAGAMITEEVTDQFWGDRTFRFADPDGYVWMVAQKVREMELPEGFKTREAVAV